MTGMYFFVRRDGGRVPVEIDQMTDAELDDLLAKKLADPEFIVGIAKMLAKWIRDNVKGD